MPAAIALSVREEIVRRRNEHETFRLVFRRKVEHYGQVTLVALTVGCLSKSGLPPN